MWDSHCHLDLLENLEPCLTASREAGITGVLIPGYGPRSWPRQRELLLSPPTDIRLRGGFGWHPWALDQTQNLDSHRQKLEEEWSRWSSSALRPVAVGEFGLDRSGERRLTLELQKGIFELHLQWANRLELPVILHLVKSDGLALELLQGLTNGGVVHSYGSHWQMMAAYAELDLSFSFGVGLLRSDKVRESLRRSDPERILFETDGPAALAKHFAQPHGPNHLGKIVETASQVLGKSVEWCKSLHRENCQRIFKESLS